MKTTANTTTAKAAKATKATKAAATRKPAVPVIADSPAWSFAPDAVTLLGQRFAATYSVAGNGDVYVFATMSDAPVRLHIAPAMPTYHDAFDAAMAAKQAAKQPAKQAETKAAKPAPAAKQPEAKPEPKPAKAAPAAKQPKAEYTPKHGAKPAPAAKQPKAEYTPKHGAAPAAKQPEAKPAAKPAPAAKQPDAKPDAWIGTAITGKGWTIAFDQAAQRTRVTFAGQPSAKQKAAVEAAGFYWSAPMRSWNKKLTQRAYRAAQALASTLTSLS